MARNYHRIYWASMWKIAKVTTIITTIHRQFYYSVRNGQAIFFLFSNVAYHTILQIATAKWVQTDRETDTGRKTEKKTDIDNRSRQCWRQHGRPNRHGRRYYNDHDSVESTTSWLVRDTSSSTRASSGHRHTWCQVPAAAAVIHNIHKLRTAES